MVDCTNHQNDRNEPETLAANDLAAPRMPSISKVHRWLYVLFFFSGMASLTCETIWFKQLQFVLGSSTFSVSVVVACFFGGFAIGGWLGGLLADRCPRLLVLYALLELILGLASAAVTVTLSSWQTWVAWLAPWIGPQSNLSRPLTVLLAAGILIIPTALMGATLPVLAKYQVRSDVSLSRRISLLYGANTLGGATGCALVGFFLIGWLGVIESALLASFIYVVIALGAIVAILFTSAANQVPESRAPDREPIIGGSTVRSDRWLKLVFALTGFTSIAYEVLWFRLLTYFGVHTVYAFAGMLTTYLLGLVLGALITARYLASRTGRHLLDFAQVQLLTAAATIVSLALLGRAPNILEAIAWLEQRPGLNYVLADAFAANSGFFGLCLIVMLLPCTLIGISFPLAMELIAHRHITLGSRIGMLYSVNTLGGVLSSLIVGFALLPLLGCQLCYMTIVLLNLALFMILVCSEPSLRADRRLLRSGVMAGAWFVVCYLSLGNNYLKQALTDYPAAKVLAFHESPDATFVVLEYRAPYAEPFQQLVVNGTSYANNYPPGRRYMGTLGHLPILLHPDPRSALVISIGTGTTVGSLTLHPRLEKIWAVDIARDVFELAQLFVPINHRYTESPKVRMVVADGRHFLLGTNLRFDVLTFEPPPPIEAGVVNLYSREFYRLAKEHMNPRAMLCQWIPLDNQFELLSRMMIRTLQVEFPHVSLWISSRMEAAIIASMEPLRIDPDRLRERMSYPSVGDDLTANGLGEPEQLLAAFVTADDGLADYVGAAPTVTDDQPRIEYYNLYSPKREIRYADILTHRQPVEHYMIRRPPDPDRLHLCQTVIEDIWYEYEEARFGRYNEAAAHLNHAIGLDPNNKYLLSLRTAAQGRQGGPIRNDSTP
jgi:predicted membrane-bound spermidine synthase